MKSTPDDGGRRADAESFPPYHLVADAKAWAACLADLQQQSRLAIDLEANSMYAYDERVCLIQISTADTDYIIDPLESLDLSGLGAIIADPAVEKVFHAAEYDLILLRRGYDWHLNNLFDTMWAARILGYNQIGLASLLEQFYDVRLSKRYQKANWCQRPLTDPLLSYGQKDTHYLLDLRDRLDAELRAGGHEAEAQEIFAEQTRVTLPDTAFDPEGYWNINGVYDLAPNQRAVFRDLYQFRDREARRRDVPHFKVISDRTLLELATALPTRPHELDDIYGMSSGQRQRYGRQLLSVINGARNGPAPTPPKRRPRPPDSLLHRYDRLHTWRKQRARDRGVESDVIASRDALWRIAEAHPQSPAELEALNVLGPWRFQTYGDEILRLMRKK